MKITDSSGRQIGLVSKPSAEKKHEFLIRSTTDEGVVRSKEGSLSLDRVGLNRLEVLSVKDALLNRAVLVYVQKIIGYGSDLYPGDETSEAQENYELIDEFINNVNFNFINERSVDGSCRLGQGHTEIVYNITRDKVLGLDDIESKTISYLKDNLGNVAYDKNNVPVGYSQTGANSMTTNYFSYDDILALKWTDLGMGIWGLGIVEPVFDISLIKINLRDAYGESMHRLANPLICAKVGRAPTSEDPMGIEASSELINQAMEYLQNIGSKSTIAHPEYMELYILEPKNTKGVQINEFIDQQIMGLGIPKTILSGTGESTNKSTASVLSLDFMSLIRNKQAKLQNMWENFFKFKLGVDKGIITWYSDSSIVGGYWVQGEGDIGPIPKLRFKTTAKEELASRIETLKLMAESGFIKPIEEDEVVLREILEMPTRDMSIEGEDVTKVKDDVEDSDELIQSLITLPKQKTHEDLTNKLAELLCSAFDKGRKSSDHHSMHAYLRKKAKQIVESEKGAIIAATLEDSYIKADTIELNKALKKSTISTFKQEIEKAHRLGALAKKGIKK